MAGVEGHGGPGLFGGLLAFAAFDTGRLSIPT
jgi:hypothetical protein